MSYSKYYIYKRQYSDDDGVTWQDVYPSETKPGGEPIGTYDTLAECEGSPGPTGGTKWVATFTGGTTASAECDSSSAITHTNGEVSSDVVSIQIGDCVTAIDYEAFNQCRSLTSITIPNSVTYIGPFAFYKCTSLPSVTIPSSMTNIEGFAFYDCYSLTSITIEATTPPSLGTSVFNNTGDCPIYVPSASVNAYKSASRWSTYASRIQAIT